MTVLLDKIKQYFSQFTDAAIAFSGGVDSTLLAFLGKKYMGENVLLLSIETPYVPKKELQEAKQFCIDHHIKHEIISLGIPEIIKDNPENRCYLCKNVLFQQIIKTANDLGYFNIFDGTNHDDLSDYRPGMKALKELRVRSPFLELGMGKKKIYELSQYFNLPTQSKPSNACLLTRLEFNRYISVEQLDNIETAENYLTDLGFAGVRVRAHNNIARIEVPLDVLDRFKKADWPKISNKLQALGFKRISVDLDGYSTGSMNK